MAKGRKKNTTNKNDLKIAYTPKTEEEKEKILRQLIKDLKSGKKTVPVSYPNERWRI